MPVRLRLGSRRLPWPNDMRVGPFGVDLVADQAGVALYSKKAIPFEQVDPAVFDYAGSEPYRERTFVFRNPFQGVGQYLQIGQAPTRRSMECLDVDTSLGFAIKGPFTHRIDPATTGSVAEFVEGYYQGSLNLFALCGQYVNVMNTDAHEPDSDSDDAIQVLDLGAGILATQGVRFRGTGGGDVDALYVANTGTHVKQYASDAWHDCAFPAQAIDVRREELWFGYQNKVRKVEADPTVALDFSAPIAIGDASTNITWISHVLDGLVIFKTAGIYSLNVDLAAGSVLDTDLWPHLAIARDDNGKGANVWLGNQMFASFGNALWRITPQIAFSQVTSLDIAPVALNVNEIPDSLAFGRPVVTAGHNDWWNYTAMYNQQTGKSYLGKYGSWITPDIAGGQATTFVQGFHCAIREFTGQITAMKIWGRVGEPERLWIGFADGHIEWAWLSQVSRNPVNESVENGGRCLPGDVLVHAPSGVAKGTQRAYSGELIEIATASGKKLSATPNHPVMTDSGWMSAGEIKEGDYVISRAVGEVGYVADHHPDDRDLPIGEVFRLLANAGATQRIAKGAPFQFHGDGQYGEVNVVAPDRLLSNRVASARNEHAAQGVLSVTDRRQGSLASESLTLQQPFWRRNASDSRIGRLHDRLTTLWRHSRVHQTPRSAVATAQPGSRNTRGDSRRFHPGHGSDLVAAEAGQVQRDRVLSLRRRQFSGHVYNLQTVDHTYFAGGILTHNCEFVVGDGYVRWPKFNAGLEGITKWLKGFSAFGPVISSWNRVQQQYRNSPGASWSQLVDDFINAGERHDVAAVELGQELDTRTILHNESIYSTPVLEGVGLHFQIRPEQTYEHTGVFEAHAAASARNGTVGLDGADAIRAYLRDTMETRGSVTCYLPGESKQELLFLDHAENLKARNRSTGREWDMPFRAVQFESVMEIGTFRRLGKWTFRQLGKVRMKGLVKI